TFITPLLSPPSSTLFPYTTLFRSTGKTMTGGVADWLMTTGRGDRPTLRWSFSVDAPLTDLRLSRETGEVIAADQSGGIYLLDRRSEEHTSELQSPYDLVCRLLLEK